MEHKEYRKVTNHCHYRGKYRGVVHSICNLKGRPEAKDSPFFLCHYFNNFMEKDLCTMFCGALISSQKVMKLQGFESGVTDVRPVNVQNNSAIFFFVYFS